MRAATRITTGLVQEWIEHFLSKNKDYTSSEGAPVFENADVLGVRGQFAEVWRKIFKLKKGLWDGETLTHEQPREILLDLIGHCFLAIDMLDRQEEEDQERERQALAQIQAEDAEAEGLTPFQEAVAKCGDVCYQGHTYTGNCVRRRNRGNKDA